MPCLLSKVHWAEQLGYEIVDRAEYRRLMLAVRGEAEIGDLVAPVSMADLEVPGAPKMREATLEDDSATPNRPVVVRGDRPVMHFGEHSEAQGENDKSDEASIVMLDIW